MKKGMQEKDNVQEGNAQKDEEMNKWEYMHRYELEVFPNLKNCNTVEDLEKETHLEYVEIMRALQWLENKGLVKIKKEAKDIIILGKNGIKYKKDKLPEIRFIDNISKLDKQEFTIDELRKVSGIESSEFNIVLGMSRKLGLITLEKGKAKINLGQFDVVRKQSGQSVLDKLENKHSLDELDELEKHLIKELQKRKDILTVEKKNQVVIEVTEEGSSLMESIPKNLDELKRQEDKLTPEMLKDGSWKSKRFRPFDVSINVPSLHGGKRHFVNQAIDYIRKIWLELGFKEMEGSFVQTAFRDLDILYVPQDHPARTMQDTFYIEDPEHGDIPKELAAKIRDVHENGGDTGSTGWKYEWKEEEAKQILLRTHTTVLSALTLLNNPRIPGKYFAIGRNFRNETLDWKHLFEFFQVEGIVVGEDVNLAQLKGYLKNFYTKMGYKDVRMRPAHFPYTEPSMEIDVLHPKGKWIELGGAGIFRPEVTKSLLGKEVPVLAWGQGMERIISSYYKITDIRDLYKNDINQMKNMKLWLE